MKRLRVFLANVGRRLPSTPSATPPLGILCLAAYVRDKLDVDLRLADQRVENWMPEQLVREIAAFEPEVVGFSALTSFSRL